MYFLIKTYRQICYNHTVVRLVFPQMLFSFSSLGQYLRVTKSLASEYSYRYTDIQLCVRDRRSTSSVCAGLTITLSKDCYCLLKFVLIVMLTGYLPGPRITINAYWIFTSAQNYNPIFKSENYSINALKE